MYDSYGQGWYEVRSLECIKIKRYTDYFVVILYRRYVQHGIDQHNDPFLVLMIEIVPL